MTDKVGQEQIHDLLFKETLSWQEIIYDLINSEQLDPWDINLSLLSQKYLDKVRQLEEANFFISSKVLLAASLLLRLKSEILLNRDIPDLDDILFGREEEQKSYVQERIELDDDIPDLVPRTPLPRFKKVTLDELMAALGKAISTETRRIKKEIIIRQQERETEISLPKRILNLQENISGVYAKIKDFFGSHDDRISFSNFLNMTKEEKLAAFVSLLHLDNQQKVWLEQEGHLEEIWIWIKEVYERKNKDKIDAMRKQVDDFYASQPVENFPYDEDFDSGFSHPIVDEIEDSETISSEQK